MQTIKFKKEKNSTYYIDGCDSSLTIGVAAKNSNTTNYALNFGKIRKNEKYLLHIMSGLSVDNIFFLNQVHEDQVLKVNTPTDNRTPFIGNADAMITERKEYMLVIRTADCVPVIMFDKKQNAIAAVHSGWRSLEKKICSKTITRMKDEYETAAEDLEVYILPAIGADAYQVNMDVAKYFEGHYTEKEDGIFLNLLSALQDELQKAGVKAENMFKTDFCTFSDNDNFFSHRRGDKGRNLNFVYIK